MLLNFIVLVLRETLEASILVSLMLVISRHHQIRLRWVLLALILGFLGALSYAAYLPVISEWFDYVGQEITGAALQLLIYLLVLCLFLALQFKAESNASVLPGIMVAVVATAVVREGSELVVFFSGFLQGGGYWLNAATSGLVGLAIGMSFGGLCYYLLMSCHTRVSQRICSLVLSLVAAGMVMQAMQLLIQADWLPGMPLLWDSNWLLSESSIVGQTTYAIFGYEATPSLTEVTAYLIAITLLCAPWILKRIQAK